VESEAWWEGEQEMKNEQHALSKGGGIVHVFFSSAEVP